MFAFLLQIHDAAHGLHGRGANFAFGHSCELEGSKLKAGCWRLDLRHLGRRAAESEPRARGEDGFVSNLVRRGLPRRMALAVVAVLGFQVSQIVPQACPSR